MSELLEKELAVLPAVDGGGDDDQRGRAGIGLWRVGYH
jgi:hypothetical protein